MPGADIAGSVARFDWDRVTAELDSRGHALLAGCLTEAQCAALIALYPRDDLFRRRIVMQQHGYGSGEYQYFAYPLPEPVAALRVGLYSALVGTANRWSEQIGSAVRYPREHREFIERCHADGQCRPTPLLLRYARGDYNRLHQDLYGEHVFPLQVAILLSRPQHDFSGGEFVLTEQRPRQQARAEVVPLQQGDAVIFAVAQRPAQGVRRIHRVTMRHGVSLLRRGERHTLGIIFHDAV